MTSELCLYKRTLTNIFLELELFINHLAHLLMRKSYEMSYTPKKMHEHDKIFQGKICGERERERERVLFILPLAIASTVAA